MTVGGPKDHCDINNSSDFTTLTVEFIVNKRRKKYKETLGLQMASSK